MKAMSTSIHLDNLAIGQAVKADRTVVLLLSVPGLQVMDLSSGGPGIGLEENATVLADYLVVVAAARRLELATQPIKSILAMYIFWRHQNFHSDSISAIPSEMSLGLPEVILGLSRVSEGTSDIASGSDEHPLTVLGQGKEPHCPQLLSALAVGVTVRSIISNS